MKSKARHELKQNEFAEATARVVELVGGYRRQTTMAVAALMAVIVAIGAYFYWQGTREDKAGTLFGIAMETADGTVAPPSTLPGATQAPNTFPTAKARSEAALKLFQEVAAKYPSTEAGTAAKYQAAGELLSLGRVAEAETIYTELSQKTSSVYAMPSRLGLAQAKMAAGKYDDAVKMLTELSGDRDGAVPVDGVLMQLAEASAKAGKSADARAAYKRVVDEFADSGYAADARLKLAALN